MSQGHELVVVTLENNDSCLFLNNVVLLSLDAGDNGETPLCVGEKLAVALGCKLHEISMQVPSDSDWNWDDVNELMPPIFEEMSDAFALVSLDGGVTYQDARNGVRVIYPKQCVDGEEENGELHINLTHEGIIMDVWVSREEHLDHNIGTSAQLLEDLISKMVEENS